MRQEEGGQDGSRKRWWRMRQVSAIASPAVNAQGQIEPGGVRKKRGPDRAGQVLARCEHRNARGEVRCITRIYD
ncbi:hypothetical protein SL003B_3296 [Polymorphum gilvum SL003B-26A1]|uniref:Uncharacterized protein n=1 Tax=Polymorphum gilvum (strain LMG 25793 / CGMCC 1.9160 / SL003B-26A1) TaxID=991905 RepID=F2IYA5_POLGS|nr:hypothetical protein SL003B_3296 [Polymorphum gilvum SL003B-26A1]